MTYANVSEGDPSTENDDRGPENEEVSPQTVEVKPEDIGGILSQQMVYRSCRMRCDKSTMRTIIETWKACGQNSSEAARLLLLAAALVACGVAYADRRR